jgi:hypothetical protein
MEYASVISNDDQLKQLRTLVEKFRRNDADAVQARLEHFSTVKANWVRSDLE